MDPNNWYYVLFILFLTALILKQLNGFRDLRGIFLSKSKAREIGFFYNKYFKYYTQLSRKEKRRFVYRAYALTQYTKIIGRQGFVVTEKVKLFVVAAQVQITFGFSKYHLSKFKAIFIYPDSYRNPMTGNMHDGEVNPRGLIVLSWKKLVKGHSIPNDRINLGLHEMAHALMHTILHTNQHEIGLDFYLDKIVKLSKEEMIKIKGSEHHFFRKYAGTNIFEFFAIAVEYFFEIPVELKKEFPQLYSYLGKLLKQDPANNIYRL